MSNHLPWDIAPALLPHRLAELLEVVLGVHEEVLVDHRPEMGETRVSLGLRRYERTCHRLELAGVNRDWLEVTLVNLECLIFIEDVVLKFSYDDPLAPRASHTRIRRREQEAQYDLFAYGGLTVLPVTGTTVWRLFIEPGQRGSLMSVGLYNAESGDPLYVWRIDPGWGAYGTPVNIGPPPPSPTVLPVPPVVRHDEVAPGKTGDAHQRDE
jgi:hypothetical protein